MAEFLYRSHILCCRGTSCTAGGSQSVFSKFNEEIAKKHLDKEAKVIMTGCHGLCEIGPIVVIYPEDVLYCRVQPEDVEEIVEETLIKGRNVTRLLYQDPMSKEAIPQYHDIPFYRNQVRVILQNCGLINPEKIEEYIARDGYQALAKALTEMTPEEVIDEIKRSGLRGRGGAGFPVGLKWELTRRAEGDIKYLVCNADEGDPGAFMDRSLIEGDPHSLLEGMIIAGYATGAQKGVIYCRAEYPLAISRLRIAIAQAHEYGLLGEDILGTGFSFDLDIMEGAGAFVCGEETALLASIMENRGEPRPRPPFPATSGLWAKPTNINNVKSYATTPRIILKGAEWFSSMGTERSKGTAVFALTGRVNNTGLVEVPMGITLGEIIFDIGGGIAKGRKFKAVQTGGPLGGCLPADYLNTPIDYDSLKEAGATMGSGGMIVVDETTCMVELARYFLQFATAESCGQCPPCRIGGQKLLEILNRITRGQGKLEDFDMIEDIAQTMQKMSLCALGQLTPSPLLTTLRYFKEEFIAHIVDKRCPAGTCNHLAPAPCRNACPAEVNAPVYVSLVGQGKYDEALKVHREANPFPSICGRVCPAFCEKVCKRGELDESVAIRQLKRFMADHESKPWKPEKLEPDKPEKVAVVGGGPGGLTAALRLAQLGYGVTIYESLPVLGGMLAVGIPEYRLPRDVLRREIESILSIGNIEVKLNTTVGKDVQLDELKEQYDAVLLAVGAHASRKLGIPGEDKEGVLHGVDFLRDMNLGKDMSFAAGKRVAIIGGGDVAIDVARSFLRLGAADVHIVYRRRRQDMPAMEEEIVAAEHEGVKFHYLAAPIEILGGEKVEGARCQVLKLEDENRRPVFDSSSRKRPFPVEDAEFSLDVDLIVPAIGQMTDETFQGKSGKLEMTRGGTILADERTFLTSEMGVFAIGDAVSGPSTVVWAIGQGNKAARSIHRYIQKMELMEPAKPLERPEGVGEFEMDEQDAQRPRGKASILAPEVRTSDFREVELGFPGEMIARNEARRCLRCDLEPLSE